LGRKIASKGALTSQKGKTVLMIFFQNAPVIPENLGFSAAHYEMVTSQIGRGMGTTFSWRVLLTGYSFVGWVLKGVIIDCRVV